LAGLIWLASYPKSGNTWVRAFLTSYLAGRPVELGNLVGSLIASDRHVFDDLVGIEAADLTEDEIGRCRPEVYRRLAALATENLFVKVHDAYRVPGRGDLFPIDVTASALYLMRNPLDVVVSLSHHKSISLDEAVAMMCGPAILSESVTRLRDQLSQHLQSWSEHVCGWVDAAELTVSVTRYEDLLTEPFTAFARLLEAARVPVVEERLAAAIASSSFEVLRQQERDSGFGERPVGSRAFFRQGASGGWRESLSEQQASRVIQAHGKVMHRFGYLDDDQQPI
jgi:hypothetical protein